MLHGKSAWVHPTEVFKQPDLLSHAGLRFEDIIDNDATLVNAAVTRMTPEEQLAREARLRRALDISAKKTALPAEMQAAHDPNANDLFKHIINITAEETERQEILGKQDYQWGASDLSHVDIGRDQRLTISLRVYFKTNRLGTGYIVPFYVHLTLQYLAQKT